MALQRTDTQSTILSTAATHGSVTSPRTDSAHKIIDFGPPVISDLEDNEAARRLSPRILTSLEVAQYFDSVAVPPIPSSSTNRLQTNGLLYSPAQTVTTLASVECHPPSPRPASEDENIVPNPNPHAYLTDWRVEYPHLFTSESTPEPGTFTAGPSDVRPSPSQALARGEDIKDENAEAERPLPKKRRRRGPRLTRVKNERAKRAAATAKGKDEGKGKGKGKAKAPLTAGPTSFQAPVCSSEASRKIDAGPYEQPNKYTGLLTRAAARREAERERAEAARAEAATKKNKGKGKARDATPTAEAAAGSKRRREEDDDTTQQNAEPGPSRPTRRTRRRIAFEEASAPSTDSQSLVPQNDHEQERVIGSDDRPSPSRGQKRHRSLAPEPSDGLIEAIRKRARFDSPEPDSTEATSSRVMLDHQQPSPLTNSADEEMVESLMELQYPDPESEDSPEPAFTVDTNILEQIPAEAASPTSTASSSDALLFYPVPAPPQPQNIVTQPAPPPSLQHLLNPILPQSISVPVGPENHRLRRHETQLDNFRVYRPENPDYWRRD